MVTNKFLLLSLFTIIVSCGLPDSYNKKTQFKPQDKCDSLEIQVYNSFPEGFLLFPPTVKIDGDTLKMRYHQKWEDQHIFLIIVMASKTMFIFDSIGCHQNQNGELRFAHVEYEIFSPSGEHKVNPVLFSTGKVGTNFSTQWKGKAYKSLNDFILTGIDPKNFWMFDELLEMYYEETGSSDFNTDIFRIYADITEKEIIGSANSKVLDSLVVRTNRNADHMDAPAMKELCRRFYLVESEFTGEIEYIEPDE